MNNQATGLWPILMLATLMIVTAGSLHAASPKGPSQEQWQQLNSALVTQHIMPRYKALQKASAELEMRSKALCIAPDMAHLEQTRAAFHETMDAWQGIQHVQFGPIENLMRNFSMQFWPDKKNLIGKQLNNLLKVKDPETLSPEYFNKASIGVKGLPAIERLLFSNSETKEFSDNSYKCQLTSAISSYIATNSQATIDEWANYSTSVTTAGSEGSYYEDHKEAAVDMMKSLVEPVEVVRDLKVLRPLGGEVKEGKTGKVRAKRTESWRSERSLQNIQINIAALHQLYSGTDEVNVKQLLAEQGSTAQAEDIEQQFITVESRLQQIPAPLITQMKQGDTIEQLQHLSTELKQLHQKLSSAMQPLNIQLGFNSRDGD